MQWTDDLNTGISEIDEQHRRIVDYINGLEAGGSGKLEEVLDGLLDYTINHFLYEEKLMERAGYEFLGAHEKVHELFARRIADFRKRFAEGEDITDELHQMLSNWLEHHIREEDQGYVEVVAPLFEVEDERNWATGLFKKLFG